MPSLKTLALPLLPPHLGDAWPQAFDALRAPPSCKSPFQQLRSPPSPFQELSKLIEAPDALQYARAAPAPPPAPATTKTGRGAPPIHDWDTIKRIDAEFCRTCAANGRPPTWKERHTALEKKLGKNHTPHLKTLQKRLPKLRS